MENNFKALRELTLPYGVTVSRSIVEENSPRVVILNKLYSINTLEGFVSSNPKYKSILKEIIKKNRLTRCDIADYFRSKSLHESVLCALLWGSLNVKNLKRYFNEPVEDCGNTRGIESKLLDVKEKLNNNKIDEAFSSMLRGHQNHIAGVGVSFLTKILYFLSYNNDNSKLPLIYDKWTQSIHATLLLSENKHWIQLSKSESGSYNAPTFIQESSLCYLDYIERMHNMGKDLTVRADLIEEYLFGTSRKDAHNWNDNNPRKRLVDYILNHESCIIIPSSKSKKKSADRTVTNSNNGEQFCIKKNAKSVCLEKRLPGIEKPVVFIVGAEEFTLSRTTNLFNRDFCKINKGPFDSIMNNRHIPYGSRIPCSISDEGDHLVINVEIPS